MMRKMLSSSNPIMVVIIAILLALALWTVFEFDQDAEVASEVEKSSVREDETSLGGGPLDEEESLEGETPEELDAPEADNSELKIVEEDEPQLEQPQLEQSPPEPLQAEPPELEPPQFEEPDTQVPSPEAIDDVDQEAAFQTDDAPEADVIGVEPPDSDGRADEEEAQREGGGPLDEGEAVEGQAVEGQAVEGETDEEAVEGEAGDVPIDGVSGEMPADEPILEQPPDTQQPAGDEVPLPSPADESEEDDSMIERPGLRRAPAPSRPGEE